MDPQPICCAPNVTSQKVFNQITWKDRHLAMEDVIKFGNWSRIIFTFILKLRDGAFFDISGVVGNFGTQRLHAVQFVMFCRLVSHVNCVLFRFSFRHGDFHPAGDDCHRATRLLEVPAELGIFTL